MMRLGIACAVAVALAAIALVALRERPPLVVGYISSLSGKYAALGATARDGALMAVEEVNRAGGVGGRRLELSIADDAGEPARAASAAEAFAASGLGVILGPFTTSAATALLPVIDRTGQIAIGPSVAGHNLAGRDDGFFRLYPSSRDMGRALAAAAAARGCTTAVVVGDLGNADYLRTAVDGFRADGRVALAAEVPFRAADADHARLAGQALAARPGAVLLVASALDAALLCQHLRQRDPAVLLLTTAWAVAPELLEHGGRSIEGLIFPQPFDLDDRRPSWRAFVDAYRARYARDPSHVAALNYEAVFLLAGALAEGDAPRVVKRRLLAAGPQTGLQDGYALDATGDVVRPLVLHAVRNGAFRRAE